MVTVIKAVPVAPTLVNYLTFGATKDKDQDKLERIAEMCSQDGDNCPACQQESVCWEMYKTRTDRNTEHY